MNGGPRMWPGGPCRIIGPIGETNGGRNGGRAPINGEAPGGPDGGPRSLPGGPLSPLPPSNIVLDIKNL